MLQINDDINDELFRRAAESYPLKTDNDNWEAVLAKMNAGDDSDEPVVFTNKRKNNYRFLLLLLLLIPLVIFENIKSPLKNNAPGKTINRATISTTKINKSNSNHADSTLINKTDPFIQPGLAATESNSVQPANSLHTRSVSQKTHSLTNYPVEEKQTGKNKHPYSARKKSKIKTAAAESDDLQATKPFLTKSNKHKKKIKGTSAIAIKEGNQENFDIAKKEITKADNNQVQPVAAENEISTAIPGKLTDPAAKTDSLQDSTKKSIVKTTQEEENKKTSVEENKKKKSTKKHFYAGLIIGPDFSTVKLQSVKKTGLSYGFLLGYRITKKWSIEAGLLQDRKYYSTDGKYFNTKDLNYPPTVKIEYVTGVCKMLELPLNFHYTFYKRNRSGLFGSAGVSAFFMQHESYVYDINYNGYYYPRSYEYDNKSKSIPAIINISAGYTYKAGKIGDLRIEPYIKLPINKIGTGKLPIQSGGVFIVFTKDIF